MVSFPDQSNPDDCPSYESEIIGFDTKTNEYFRFTNDLFEDSQPSYSPSRDKILFCSKRPISGDLTGAAPKGLFILDISTGNIEPVNTQLSNNGEDNLVPDYSNPVWSPVSDQIAFTIEGSDNGNLIILDMADDEISLKMNVPSYITKIRWSADGRFLAYTGIATKEVGNINYMTFELGFIDINKQIKKVLEQSAKLNWDLISGVPGSDKFLIYNADSVRAPIKIYEYDINTNNRKYLTSTMERRPEECGATENEIFFVKTAEDKSRDIWLLNVKDNTFKQITFDGKMKSDISYFKE
jgi:Tol biopolymer transport system component